MASVYSGAGEGRYGTVQVKGMVEFGMQYNYKQCALEIHVKQCKDLAAVDTKRNRSDPYVKVNSVHIMIISNLNNFSLPAGVSLAR
jgi:synaptotagmin-like protein